MSEGGTVPIDDGRVRRSSGAPARPHLFVLLQCHAPRRPGARFCLAGLDQVELGRSEEAAYRRDGSGGLRRLVIGVADPTMSTNHARLVQAFGRWRIEDRGSRNGTVVDGTRRDQAPLRDGALIEVGHTLLLYRDDVPTADDDPIDHDAAVSRPPLGLETLQPPLSREFAKLSRVAASEVPIVLAGETGVGKEVLAQAVHRLSTRPGAFVAVNCGAIPQALVESELFGHRKGAFTGAEQNREGLIRAADKGTLFLDEIGDLPFPAQAAFLRVLQEREVRSVGATRSVPVDLRVVAATHRDLGELVDQGSFRRDLYARLMGFTLRLPALRERREDLGLVISRLLDRIAPGADGPQLSLLAARALCRYDWPLNIREVEQCLRAAVVLAGDRAIDVEHLPPVFGPLVCPPPEESSTDDAELRGRLLELLQQHGGNVSAVARSMGKARPQVQRWLKRLGIDAAAYR